MDATGKVVCPGLIAIHVHFRAPGQPAKETIGTGAAAGISLVIALLFISAWIEAQIGTLIAACWILTMILLIIGLIYFFRATRLAAVGVKSPHRLQNRFWKRTKRKHGGS